MILQETLSFLQEANMSANCFESIYPKIPTMLVPRSVMSRYLNTFAAFRDRSLYFQLTVIVLLVFIFSFTITRIIQLAQYPKDESAHEITVKANSVNY
jgi:hypothetical protein